MNRVQLLQQLITYNNYSSYLELGVEKGETYRNIQLADKTGVDINSRHATHHMSTDEFFQQCDRKFDLIFIDALHTYKQVLVDFDNSLKCLNDGGCIVLHDCLPTKEKHQLPTKQRRHWTGDVWKAMVRIRQKEGIRSFVLDTDWGLGIVFRGINDSNLDQIPEAGLTWGNYLRYRDKWLGIISLDEYDNQICQRLHYGV